MKLRIEAEPGELVEKALPLVGQLAARLAEHDPRLRAVAEYCLRGFGPSKMPVLAKSLGDVTASPPTSERVFAGLPIVIETAAGTIRHWSTPETRGSTQMLFDYGYIKGTRGADGDEYDVFLGPDESAPFVFIVHQRRPKTAELYDEDKAMLGFPNVHAASEAYSAHYDDPSFLGSLSIVTIDEFRSKLLEATKTDGMVKAKRDAEGTGLRISAQALLFEPAAIEEVEKAGQIDNLGDRAVDTGVDGVNIAMETPPRPIQGSDPFSPESYRAAMEVVAEDRPVEGAIRRDPEVYVVNPLVMLPNRSLEEWVALNELGAEARTEAPSNKDLVQTNLDRRSWFIREGHPERLLPRDPRVADLVLIPEDPKVTAAQENKQHRVLVAKKMKDSLLCELYKSGNGFEVLVQNHPGFSYFSSLSAACDYAWALSKGFTSADAWRTATGRRKLPSGAGWKFWGIEPENAPGVQP